MSRPGTVPVIGPGGLHGTIDTTTWPLDGSHTEVFVQFEDGSPVLVPLTALVRQDDGSYRLNLDAAELEHRARAGHEPGEPRLVLPVIQESLDVEKRTVETGRVRLRKVVQEREVLVDPLLQREQVVVERIPINRIVEGPVPERTEGETLVIPVLEEVLVVEKRLLLKEEVRLTKQQSENRTPQWVTLRREEAVVERLNRQDHQGNSTTEEHHHGEDNHRSV